MSRLTVEQLRDGEGFDEVYLAAEKQLRTNKNGTPYLQVELRDRTGSIVARMWNASDQLFRSFASGDFVQCEGKVQLFNGTLQVILDRIERADANKIDTREFLPRSEQDVPKLYEKLKGYLFKMASPHLRALAECYLMDDAFVRAFCSAPAGMKLHHAYLGGLLEHTAAMMDMAERVLPYYPGTDRDLVLMGLFLHDSGKVRELAYASAFGYTDEGQLLGHIPIGIEMLNDKAAQVPELLGEPVPRELMVRLKHIVLSHHGELEQGSPKVPMTPEAMLVHCIDTMDSRMNMVLRDLKDDRNNPTAWTQFNTNMKRRWYKGGANGDLFAAGAENYD